MLNSREFSYFVQNFRVFKRKAADIEVPSIFPCLTARGQCLTTAQVIRKRNSRIVSKEDHWRSNPRHIVSYGRKIVKCNNKNT